MGYMINSWVRLCEEQLTEALESIDLEACATYKTTEKDGLEQMKVNIENYDGEVVTFLYYAISEDGRNRIIYDAIGNDIGSLELQDVLSHIKTVI